MKLGVALPQTAIEGDPTAITEFAHAAESIGYNHLATYDHVLGANLASRPDWKFPYTSAHAFALPSSTDRRTIGRRAYRRDSYLPTVVDLL